MRSAEEERQREEELEDKEGRRRSDRWIKKENLISRLRYGRWRGVKRAHRREASQTGS